MMRNFNFLLLLSILCSTLFVGSAEFTQNCMVTLPQGGKLHGNCSHSNYNSFTNVPFAKPPIGDLRFEAPQPEVPWSDIRSANTNPNICTQFLEGSSEMSGQENCLFLQIYTPKKGYKIGRLPVVIWLHGGIFQSDGTDSSPDVVMKQGGAIWVKVGFRLGPYGFLSTGDTRMPGNNGLKDQRLAIDWIMKNIAAFGGDPKKMVLVGNAAGSASVEYHLITGTKGIAGYASLSGSVLNSWAYHEKPEIPARILGEKLNCSIDDPSNAFKKCLQKAKTTDVWSAVMKMHKYRGFSPALFRPTREPRNVMCAFMTQKPQELIECNNNTKKNYYVSVVVGEGAFMAASFLRQNEVGVEFIKELNENWNNVCPIMFMLEEESPCNQIQLCKTYKDTYMANEQFTFDSYKRLALMFGDRYFYKEIEHSILLHILAGQAVYMGVGNLPKRYNLGNLLSGRKNVKFESVHGSDALMILPAKLNCPSNPPTVELSETQKHFIEFLLSLASKCSPAYNGTVVPPNIEGIIEKPVIYFTYGFHKIDTCPNMRKIIANVTGTLEIEE